MKPIQICHTILILFLATSLSAAEKKLVKRVDTYIAVLDLETVGKVEKDVVRPLTDSVRREIVKAGKYEVMDRSNMDKVLKEQAFQMTGCTSKECAVEAGQLLGVGRIIVGSVSMVGKTYLLSLSLVNVGTGKVELVEDQECKCEIDDLIKLSKQVSVKLMGGTPDVKIVEAAAKANESLSNAPSGATYVDPVTGMEFVLVKGGCFERGDTFGDGAKNERPVLEVCLSDYYVGKYEVTQEQWEKIMGDNPSSNQRCGAKCPVESVSWHDVKGFVTALNRRAEKNFRLPTEAEWEYAARSGGKRHKWVGTNSESQVSEFCEYKAGFSSFIGEHKTPKAIGVKKPNEIGLYDMGGNVSEWIADWYHAKYYLEAPKTNPQGPVSGEFHVIRGGSSNSRLSAVRPTARDSASPDAKEPDIGFRLVHSVN